MSELIEIGQLFTPLRDDAKGIFEESDDDQESSYCR